MPTVATIGYEQSNIDQFIAALLNAGVEQVIDVRELPLSRKRGFSKQSLAAALATSGISYIHLRQLGDPKPGRIAARAGDYRQFKKIFNQHMRTTEAKLGLVSAAALAREKRSALLCFEREHTVCHRSIVADALRLSYGFKVHHLEVQAGSVAAHGDNRRKSHCTCEGGAASRRAAW